MAQTQSDKYNYGDKSIDPIKFNYLTIGVVGDSLTEQTERGPSWVQLLGEYVRVRGPEGTASLSAGVGGSTFEDALTNQIGVNLQSSQADIIQSVQPDLIFVCMGFNDIFNAGFSASKVITDADALFTRLRADNPEAHIVYIEELAYDRTNIPGDVVVTGTPIGLTNKNLLPFLQEGQNLYGLSNVYDTSSDFLDSVVSTSKHEQVQSWIDVTAHIKAQSYIDSSMVFDMFFLSRCGMHTDLIHLDRYGYKMFALDARKHIVDTPEIIGGEAGKSENLIRFGPIKSTSDTVNPNLLKGTQGLRSAFTVSGSGVNATYLYQEDFAQVGFVNHDSYDFPTRQFIWPLLNRNLRVNTQGRLIYRNDPFEFEGQALIPNSDVYIQYDDLAAQLSTQPILQNCSIKVQEPFNSFFPTGDFTPGNHLVALGFGYDNGRTEFYRKVVDIVNDSDRPVTGGGYDPTANYTVTGNNNYTGINAFNGAGFGTNILPGGAANNAVFTFASAFDNTDPNNPIITEGGVVYWSSVDNSMNIGRTGADAGIAYNLKILPTGRVQVTGTSTAPTTPDDLVTKAYGDANYGGGSNRISARLATGVSFAPGAGVQDIDLDTVIENTDPSNLFLTLGGLVISGASPYTKCRVTMGYRMESAVAGDKAIQAAFNNELPSGATRPIVGFQSQDAGTVWNVVPGQWVDVAPGGTTFKIRVSGPNGGTVQGGYQTYMQVEVM